MSRPVERLRASTRKEGRAGENRPSSVNQEVAGSSAAREANYYEDYEDFWSTLPRARPALALGLALKPSWPEYW